MSYFESFQKLIDTRDWKEQARLFDEYTKSELKDPEEAIDILKLFKQHKLADQVGGWIEKGLRLWKQQQDPEKAYEMLKLIVDLQTTNSLELAEAAQEALAQRSSEDALFSEKIRLVGLRDGIDFQGALSNYELLSHMNKGAFVFHSGGWGTGEIMDISAIREELSVEFEHIAGRKNLSFKNAFTHLIPLSKNHFLSRRFGDPDTLEQFAKKDPLGVMHLFLKDMGAKSAAEIKDEFLDLVIPEKDWSKWWQATRSKLKKDKLVFVPEDLADKFFLRDSEESHEQRFYKALEKKPEPKELIALVYSFVRDFGETLKQEEFRQDVQSALGKLQEDTSQSLGSQLEVAFLLEDISGNEVEIPKQCTESLEGAQAVLEEIDVLALKKRFLVTLRKKSSTWSAIFLELMVSIPQLQIKDYILLELIKAGLQADIQNKLQEIVKTPETDPVFMVWYFQKILATKDLPMGDDRGLRVCFEALLVLLSHAERDPKTRDLSKKVHQLILADRYALLRRIFNISTLQDTKELILVASKCQIFTEHDRKIFQSLAEVAHPSLIEKKSMQRSDDNVVWTTQEGYNRLKEKIQHIGTVAMVENAKEIEEARSHGDLRENSEFKFALEKRDRLQAEMKMLSDQFNQSRVLTAQDVDSSKVSVGSIVDVESASGEVATYKILGPMEADPDKNILSFQSQLAKSMMGKKIDESFDFKGESYQVKAIRNYFTHNPS